MSEFQAALQSLKNQELALRESLAKFLSSADGDALALEAESFTAAVFAKLRPAIVLLDPAARQYHAACQLGERGRKSVALMLDTTQLTLANAAYAPFGALLSVDLGAYAQGFIGAALQYDGGGDYEEEAFFLAQYRVALPTLTQADTVRLTAPPVEELFEGLAKRSMKDEWFWSRVKAYETWLAPLSRDRRADGVLQIGGWPEFVQYGDSDTFIAQANLGIGDAGSLYVHLEDSKLTADIQMY
jgi:hypothetical protein